jgi:hypothetical protein
MLKSPTLNDAFQKSPFYTVLIDVDNTVCDDRSAWGQT